VNDKGGFSPHHSQEAEREKVIGRGQGQAMTSKVMPTVNYFFQLSTPPTFYHLPIIPSNYEYIN
jgi:hypothetical protein